MYASFLIIPELVQAPAWLGYGFGASVTGAGLFMFPTAAVQLLLGPLSGRLHRMVSLRTQLIAAIIVTSAQAGTGAPAASGYIGALILCAAATCAGAFVACATPRKNPR